MEDEGMDVEWFQDSFLPDWSSDSDVGDDGHLMMNGGCIDRDCPDRLSPVFSLKKLSRTEASILVMESSSSSRFGTPIRNSLSSEAAISEAGCSTGAGAASAVVAGTAVFSVFSAVALSPFQVMSSDHARFVTDNLRAERFCMTLDDRVGRPPWELGHISFVRLLKPVLESPKSMDAKHEDTMVDPSSGSPYVSKDIRPADFNFWKISPGSGKDIQRFETFMFPASMSYFWPKTRTCALVMYPDVTAFIERLEKLRKRSWEDASSEVDKEQRELAAKLWSMNGGMVLSDLQSCEIPSSRDAAIELRKKLAHKIYDLLMQTWVGRTGECFVGVGRLLGYNRKTISHSVSTLPGASGAALIPTGVDCERVFVGVHSGPAQAPCKPLFDHPLVKVSRPDHNIALSCDHPDFVTQYWRHIVPELPAPSEFKSKQREKSLMPFFHWILLHLRLIVLSVERGKWSISQKLWLAEANKYWPENDHVKPDFHKLVIKIRETPEMLQQLVSLGFPVASGAHEQISFLQALKDNRFCVKLESWGMPGVSCSSSHKLALIATALASSLYAEEQHYLKVPLHEFDKCQLVQSGIEVCNTRVEVLVKALGLGFRSLFISNDYAEGIIKDALVLSPIKREHIQVLIGTWTDKAHVRKSIDNMSCEYVDVLFIKLPELQAALDDLKALVISGLVKCIGLRTDSVSEVSKAFNLLQEMAVEASAIELGVVQVDVSNGVVPADIVDKCEALNVGVISTSDLHHITVAEDDVTLAQLNVAWKMKNKLVPFTAVESGEELSKLHEVAIRQLHFRMMVD